MQSRILLAEDDISLNSAFSLSLKHDGFVVDTVFDGEEALRAIEKHEPDIILLDLLMPVMDGKAFLRNFENIHHIPIIVFSNLDSKRDVQEVIELGATRYMLKAWATPRELTRLIHDTLATKAAAQPVQSRQ